jgi:hypothetical protein
MPPQRKECMELGVGQNILDFDLMHFLRWIVGFSRVF